MDGLDLATWSDFGVAVVGAMAALTGLLFVAISINLERIIAFPNLPRLAMSTLLLFATALVASVFLLIPEQSATALGVELVVLGVGVGIPLVRTATRAPRVTDQTRLGDWITTRLAPAVLVPGLTAAAGVGLLAGWPGGLYLIPASTVIAIVAGLVGAWILLVEVQR